MKRKPVYVEIEIDTDMERLWEATQTPNMHEQWDLRFSSITYLPKNDNEPQHFTYTRSLALGKKIEGWGISTGSHEGKQGERTSALHFGTDDVISPIKEGRGYWKYIPNGKSITFLTQYDYDANFGKFGRLLDQLLFRPIIGWGTALSFDVLRRWLEKGEPPYVQYFRFFISWFITFLFSFVWIYHGLIPKILFTHKDELSMVKSLAPISSETTYWIVIFTGVIEVVFGIFWLFYKKKRHLFILQLIVFPFLTLMAIIAQPSVLTHPFNPLTFNLCLLFLSLVGFLISKDVPTATTCKRKR